MQSPELLTRQKASRGVHCLVLLLLISLSKTQADTKNLRSPDIIGCGAFEEDLCSPALECVWCDDARRPQSNSDSGKREGEAGGGGSCMEFDAWIDSCPIATLRLM